MWWGWVVGNLIICRGWSRWIDIELMMQLVEQRLLPLLLLAKDVDGVLQLWEPCSLSIYVLSLGFDTLDY
jgi:hypothetical protein